MDSTNSSSVSYKTQIPVGYVFKPDEDEIYSYFIPTRIRSKKPIYGVEEIDVYGDKSPDDLFQSRDDPRKHIYLFTRLKKEKETHSRVKRSAGDGTWQCKSKATVCVREINGKKIRIGTTRRFTYKGGKEEWIMHEYCIEEEFLNYKFNINDGRINGANLNPEKIVFCHVYNKKAKKGNEVRRNYEEFNQQKKRKSNNHGKQEENNIIWFTNYNNNGAQPLLPEPNPVLPEPEAEGDLMQEFMMRNYDTMSLPEDDQVIIDFMSTDYSHVSC